MKKRHERTGYRPTIASGKGQGDDGMNGQALLQ